MNDKDLRRKKRKERTMKVRVHDRMSIEDYERAARCKRCNRRVYGAADADRWNLTFDRPGILTGMLCPNCQTPEENAEAEEKLHSTDFMIDKHGRALEKPKTATSRPKVTCTDCSRMLMDDETLDCWYRVHISTGHFVAEGKLELVSRFELRTCEQLQVFELSGDAFSVDDSGGDLCPECATKHRLPALV